MYMLYVFCILANKRKATIPPKSQSKKLKADSTNKDETDNQQQQIETLTEESSKKEIEYQTNIAVCEVQLEELKYVCIYAYPSKIFDLIFFL